MPGWLKGTVVAILAAFIIAQAIRPSRTNPTINPAHEITASAGLPAETAAILGRACNDCHSNRTVWPRYSGVAPISWLVVYDVRAGRKKLNLSEWGTYSAERRAKNAKEMCKEVTEGDMPEFMYTLMHPQAKLTSADVQSICQWSKTVQ
jgi:mono/diheme cytochrome c family protein